MWNGVCWNIGRQRNNFILMEPYSCLSYVTLHTIPPKTESLWCQFRQHRLHRRLVIMATCSATSAVKVGIMTTRGYLWVATSHRTAISRNHVPSLLPVVSRASLPICLPVSPVIGGVPSRPKQPPQAFASTGPRLRAFNRASRMASSHSCLRKNVY